MFAGIVLAGGAASRLGGVDKPMLEVGGIPLLRRAVRALGDAGSVVVVGPQRPGIDGVRWAREDPPGSGPLAALAAGLAAVDADLVVVLAADLTGVNESTVDRFVAATTERGIEGAVLVDRDGRRQWLIGAWRTAPLRAALPADPRGGSLRSVLGGLSVAEVAAEPGEAADVDTGDDLRAARERRPG